LELLGAARPEDLLLATRVDAAIGTQRELDAAADALSRYLQIRPRDAEARYQAGLLFLRKGDRAAARDQFERAVSLDAHHALAHARLADLLQAAGQPDRAYRERAAYYELTDQPDRALAELKRATGAGDPADLESSQMAARTAAELQQLPAAVKEAENGLKRHPGDPGLMLQIGLLYQMAGSRAALEQLCRDWQARQPDSGLPYWLLGRRAMSDAREEDAIRLFQTACAKEPNQADLCADLGGAYLKAPTPGSMEQARVWLEKAVSLNARSDAAHLLLGQALERAGRLEEARRQYLDSLDVAPVQATVLSHVAQVSFRMREPAVARLFTTLAQAEEVRARQRQPLSRHVRDHPEDAGGRVQFARFLIENGQLEPARNQLTRAAESGPAAPQARAILSLVERCLRVQSG
jgi:Tfp pilus assembly protein PilF